MRSAIPLHRARRLTCASACVFLISGSVLARPIPDDPSTWRPVRHWTTEHGLPQNWIHMLSQRSDGSIWAGASSGLARLEGERFRTLEPEDLPGLGSTHVHSLSSHGPDLWLMSQAGELYRTDDGERFHGVSWPDGARPRREIQLDHEGRLGFFTSDYRFFAETDVDLEFRQLDTPRTFSPRDTFFMHHQGPEERFLHRWSADGISVVQLPSGERIAGTGVALRDREGILHVSDWTEIQRFEVNDPSGKVRRLSPIELPRPISSFVFDHGGELWVAFEEGGLARRHDGVWEMLYPDLPQGRLSTDREGSLWLGGGGGAGLWQILPPTPLFTQTQLDGLPSDVIWTSLEARDGTLWVGTRKGVVRWTESGFEPLKGTEGSPVYSLAEDAAGRLWIGALNGLKVWIPSTSTLVAVDLRNGQKQPSIRGQILTTGADMVWVAGRGGPYRIAAASLRPTPVGDGGQLGLGLHPARGIHLDRQGRLWIAAERDGVFRFDGERLETVLAQGEAHGWGFWEDGDGALWLLNRDRGLTRIDGGPPVVIDQSHGLFDNTVHHVAADDLGWLWMTSDRGIFRVREASLQAVASGEASQLDVMVFERQDGLREVECNSGYPGIVRLDDGRLTFPTMGGLVWTDPGRIHDDAPAPGILITDSEPPRPLDREAPVRLDPTRRDIEVDYAALTSVAPGSARYRYRLSGFEQDWVDAGTRRTARYTHLPPGQYTFSVQASNGEGKWSESPAELRIEAPRLWHEHAFVRALALLAALFGVWRVGRLALAAQHSRELEALVEERTRELHQEQRRSAEQEEEIRQLQYRLTAQEVEVESEDEAFLRKVLEAVEANLHSAEFGVFELAEAVHLSRRQLHRKLVALTDESPKDLLRRIRLERAAQLLEGGAGSVAQVAAAVGYTKPAHFSERFKEAYGQSPSAWTGRLN